MYVCVTSRTYALIFFFFKQKTSYEMRISDWSSDVCSSDLAEQIVLAVARQPGGKGRRTACDAIDRRVGEPGERHRARIDRLADAAPRSEEHTSELQSLMRISYAVFGLKKKKPSGRNPAGYDRQTQP